MRRMAFISKRKVSWTEANVLSERLSSTPFLKIGGGGGGGEGMSPTEDKGLH